MFLYCLTMQPHEHRTVLIYVGLETLDVITFIVKSSSRVSTTGWWQMGTIIALFSFMRSVTTSLCCSRLTLKKWGFQSINYINFRDDIVICHVKKTNMARVVVLVVIVTNQIQDRVITWLANVNVSQDSKQERGLCILKVQKLKSISWKFHFL